MADINTIEEIKAQLKEGKFTSLGSYPKYFMTADGEYLSFEAAEENLALVEQAMAERQPDQKQWRIAYVDINWEDPEMYCAHTNKRIESAYAEDHAKP